MSFDVLWYESYVDDEPPRCRRLYRVARSIRWNAIIDLAIAHAAEGAGWCQRTTRVAGQAPEEVWWWPTVPAYVDRATTEGQVRALLRQDLRVAEIAKRIGTSSSLVSRIKRQCPTDWWYIPEPIAQRARDLLHEAIATECRRSSGVCMPQAPVWWLRKWRRSGHWRKKVAPIKAAPGHHSTLPDAKRPTAAQLRKRRERQSEIGRLRRRKFYDS